MSKERSFDHDLAMQVHWQVENNIRKKYNFAEKITARWIANRKNVQISLLSAKLKPWELEAMNQYGIQPAFITHRLFIVDVVRKEFIGAVQDFYPVPVKQFYLFEPQLAKDVLFTFTLKFFTAPIFKHIDNYQLPIEEKITNMISKYIKEVNGTGPSKVQVALLRQDYLVIAGSKIFSDFQLSECSTCPAKLETFKSLTGKLLYDAAEYSCRQIGRQIFNTFTEWDIDENTCIMFLSLKLHTEEDLLENWRISSSSDKNT